MTVEPRRRGPPLEAAPATSTTADPSAAAAAAGDSSAVAQIRGYPTLVIMRGLPGSGKSTLAAQLAGPDGLVLSTDDFFVDTRTGTYVFDASRIAEAHAWNIRRAGEAMQRGHGVVVIDNTNTQRWEARPYVQHACRWRYVVEVKEPCTSWRRDADELARRNTHEVPVHAIEGMLRRWEDDFSVPAILASRSPHQRGGANRPARGGAGRGAAIGGARSHAHQEVHRTPVRPC